jgi:hypothetical protein
MEADPCYIASARIAQRTPLLRAPPLFAWTRCLAMALVLLRAHEVVAQQRACLLSRSIATIVCWVHVSAFHQTCHINLEFGRKSIF